MPKHEAMPDYAKPVWLWVEGVETPTKIGWIGEADALPDLLDKVAAQLREMVEERNGEQDV
jgi:hypothetical protein